MKLTKARLSLILAVIICLTVGTVALRILKDRQAREAPPAGTPIPLNATMALANVRQTAVKDGIKEWHLEAEAARLIESEQKMVLDRPEVEFYMQNGDILTLTARQGILNTATNDIQVSGQVVARHGKYTLKGDAFTYTHDQKMLTSQSPVAIHSPRLSMTAARMTVDLNTQQTELAGDVKGILNDAVSL